MAMEFVVLKVNGRDVSPQEAARALRTADEPLVVTLRRMSLATPPPGPAPEETAAALSVALHSVEVQTEDVWSAWPGADSSEGAPERSLHDILEQDIDLEEVTLRRSEAEEELGITLSCSCGSGSDDLDTEVYIASVEPTSLAGRDGRLQRGDQILQVNGEDITTRDMAEHMFNSPGPSITLLVSRYYSEDDGDQDDEEVESCKRPSCGKPVKPRTPTHAKHFHSDDGSTDRRSDGSSGSVSGDRRSDTSTERHSDGSEAALPATAYVNMPTSPGHRVATAACVSAANGPANGHANSPANGHTNGPANGHTNGPANGHTNGHTSGRRKETSRRPLEGAETSTSSRSAATPEPAAGCGRRLQRPPGAPALQSPTNGRPGGRPLPGSLPLVAGHAGHPLRAPSSEHIYETIPESDSEHIYCEPYEPSADYSNVQQSPLTLHLKKDGRDERTTLNLGPVRLASPLAATSGRHVSGSSSGASSAGSCSTMYTNAANLQHTIEVQQELFRQSLRQTTPTSSSRPPLPLPSASSLLQRFPPPPPVGPAAPAPSDAKMEWKVKRRADGSRYITRRPVKSRVIREALRDRAAQIRDERAGLSTEDDTASELKMGRYWTKAERKQHVRRKRQQQCQQFEHAKQQGKAPQINEEEPGRRAVTTVEASHKKVVRKKSNVDDFTTVQELLAQGSRASANAKMLGLLSVTTV